MLHSVLYFIDAIALLFLAHSLRCYRHTLLFPQKMRSQRFDLLLGLSLGQLVNVLLPWRAGDVLRALFIAHRYQLRLPFVAATVLAERLSDIVAVTAIFALAWVGGVVGAELGQPATLSLSAIGVALVVAALAVSRSARARRGLWAVFKLFNDRIRFALLDLAWSFSELVATGSLLRGPYVLMSFAMWGLYFASYALLAAAIQGSTWEVSFALLSGTERPVLRQILDSAVEQPAATLLAFTAIPVLAVLLSGTVKNRGGLWLWLSAQRLRGFQSLRTAQPMASERFRECRAYQAFLEAHFSGSDSASPALAMTASPEVLIHKILPGGSDAVTALVEVEQALKIRKCGSGKAGEKLKEQAAWLHAHAAHLPLARVIDQQDHPALFQYDMPYLLGARDFYEVIHSAPIAQSQHILQDVVDRMHHFHLTHALGEASSAVIGAYLQQKVASNASRICEFARAMFPSGRYRINGAEHNLADWGVLLDTDWLRAQVICGATATIHGDLTIENIIVDSAAGQSWYAIDPNQGNVFDSPLIDWAKLMQSLHLGYEGLNRSSHCDVADGDIKLLFLRSNAYSILHESLSQRLSVLLGAERMREIAFHELVNYLRLTPYKIRHDPAKALTFFACASVLLQQYLAVARAAPLPQVRSLQRSARQAFA